jgi:cytochrome c553
MYGHFGHASQVQSAVIAGDLEAVRSPAQWLAGHDEMAGLPQGAEPYLARLRRAAALAVDASDLSAAAAATADIGTACGACHGAFDVGPPFDPGVPPPDEGPPVVGHMMRHVWAADRMWEGLIGPSDAAWTAGARGLSEAPFEPTEVTQNAELQPTARDLARRVHELGVKAERSSDPEARGEIYGRLLAVCSRCHQLVR